MGLEKQYLVMVHFWKLRLALMRIMLGIVGHYEKWNYCSIRYFNPKSSKTTYNKRSISDISSLHSHSADSFTIRIPFHECMHNGVMNNIMSLLDCLRQISGCCKWTQCPASSTLEFVANCDSDLSGRFHCPSFHVW